MKANKTGNADFYIQSASLNGTPHSRSYIAHTDISNGGNLSFEMGDKPSTFGLLYFPSTAITLA
ncbi:MAG: glycoside hydrolase family 92 protein [Chitinophagaceae bacterium]|nr:glycoside hydrolase family 92 protein [Chitinophagaceae bacterium]